MAYDIRPYGGISCSEGYQTYLDSWIHKLSQEQNATDEEVGGEDDPQGWYGLMPNVDPADVEDMASDEDGMQPTDSELDKVEDAAGVIVHEDANGRVTITYYEDPDSLEDAWDAISERFEDEEVPVGSGPVTVDAPDADSDEEDEDEDESEVDE